MSEDIHRRYWRLVADRDWPGVRRLYHQDYLYTDTDGVTHSDKGTQVALYRVMLNAFPDVVFDDLVVSGDGATSTAEMVCRGTHLGRLGAFPPTGRGLALRACHVIDVRDGLITRERDYFDGFSMLRQLGLVPGA